MKTFIISLILIQALLFIFCQIGWGLHQTAENLQSIHPTIPEKVIQLYDEWLQENRLNAQNSRFEKDSFEYQFRLSVFYENLQTIDHLNSLNLGYEAGLNQFMDLTEEEWIQTYISPEGISILELENQMIQQIQQQEDPEERRQSKQTNQALNWAERGAVRPAENQLRCNSSYAFASKGVCEGYQKIGKGVEITLSAQQLVDCGYIYGTDACLGGSVQGALQYVYSVGLVLESNYRYVGVKTDCRNILQQVYKIPRYHSNLNPDCSIITKNLENGPVAAMVDAVNWRYYKKGVFKSCANLLTQSVLVVGYDDQQNWIVRNSWGTTWGDNGFIKLAPGNTCGLCNKIAWQSP